MNRTLTLLPLLLLGVIVFPHRCPAPLIYTPGSGWTYEPVGEDSGKWQADTASDQLQITRELYEKQDYKTAMKSAKRLVREWPLSDYAPEAQYLVAKCYSARGKDHKAFKAFQTVLKRYPQIEQYEEILQAQYDIATRFLNGQWFKLWGVIPFFPSMEKTVKLYEDLIGNGPYSSVAPQAQLNIGAAHEKQKNYVEAVKAYEKAADRYHDQTSVAKEAIYRAGLAYEKQAKTSEYDQSIAGDAISTFTDFKILYPNDGRVQEADRIIDELKLEQARGSFEIARYYEKKNKWQGALIYYNEVLLKNPNSEFAERAKTRIDEIKNRPDFNETADQG